MLVALVALELAGGPSVRLLRLLTASYDRGPKLLKLLISTAAVKTKMMPVSVLPDPCRRVMLMLVLLPVLRRTHAGLQFELSGRNRTVPSRPVLRLIAPGTAPAEQKKRGRRGMRRERRL